MITKNGNYTSKNIELLAQDNQNNQDIPKY